MTPQLAVAGRIDQEEAHGCGARGVEVVAVRGGAALGDGELDGCGCLGGVGVGGRGAALKERVEAGFAGAGGTGDKDGGEDGVGGRLGEPEVHEEGHEEDDQPADDEDGG